MHSVFTHYNALIVLACWVLIQAGILVHSAMRGELVPGMLAAVDKAGPLDESQSREETARGFVYISVVWFVAVTAVAGYAFHASYAGSVIWLLVFLALGGWSLYDAASGPVVLGKMYPGSTNWWSWVQAVAGSVVWLFLFIALALKWFQHAA